MLPLLVDTHAHLDDPRLIHQLESVLERAQRAGVGTIVTIATDPASSLRAIEIAATFPGRVCAAIGFHPNNCRDLTDRDWDQLIPLARSPGVVAIGETGLDRHWKDCPFDVQKKWFQRHLEWSLETQLPLVIHMRDCENDIVGFLQENRAAWPLRGIMHSFTGTWQTAETCLEAGLHIGFAGMVTYRNAAGLREVAKRVPGDRLLVETDSPYLSPEPVRQQRPNEPANVLHTATCLAATRQQSLTELAAATSANARLLLNIPATGETLQF